jgi:hypothetical protein
MSIFECTSFQEMKMRPPDNHPQLTEKLLEDFHTLISCGKPNVYHVIKWKKKGREQMLLRNGNRFLNKLTYYVKKIIGNLRIGFWKVNLTTVNFGHSKFSYSEFCQPRIAGLIHLSLKRLQLF